MAALGLDGRPRVALSAWWRIRDGSHCGSGLCSIVRSRRCVPLSVVAPMYLAWLARRCSSCERSWSHEPAPMPRSLGSCPVPIVASMCALLMSFACASEKMPMCRGLCHQKRSVRRWRTTYALWRFMCLYSYVWYKSTVLTCLYTYEDRIEPQRCTRNVTLPASAVGGGRSREGSSHRAGTWAPVEQNVTSGLGNRGTAVHSRVRYTQKACSCARAIPIA